MRAVSRRDDASDGACDTRGVSSAPGYSLLPNFSPMPPIREKIGKKRQHTLFGRLFSQTASTLKPLTRSTRCYQYSTAFPKNLLLFAIFCFLQKQRRFSQGILGRLKNRKSTPEISKEQHRPRQRTTKAPPGTDTSGQETKAAGSNSPEKAGR